MSDQRSEGEFTFSLSRFLVEFTDVVRHNTTKSRGALGSKEEYPAYVWRGNISIYEYRHAKTYSGTFRTGVFFVEGVENLDFEAILFLVLWECNRLCIPQVSHNQRNILLEYIINKILLDYFLKAEACFSINPLCIREGGEDELLFYQIVTSFYPSSEFKPVSK